MEWPEHQRHRQFHFQLTTGRAWESFLPQSRAVKIRFCSTLNSDKTGRRGHLQLLFLIMMELDKAPLQPVAGHITLQSQDRTAWSGLFYPSGRAVARQQITTFVGQLVGEPAAGKASVKYQHEVFSVPPCGCAQSWISGNVQQ